MTGRERFLTAISNQKPDRLPCQVHNWIEYYLKTYLNGMDQYAAYEFFGMDPVIYVDPARIYTDNDNKNWQADFKSQPVDDHYEYIRTYTTPGGVLTEKGAYNQFTGWVTEHVIKNEDDFELWNKYIPLPTLDFAPVLEAKERIGDSGIVRGSLFGFGQGSPWQSFSNCLFGTEEAIMESFDRPDWVHYVLGELSKKKLSVIERCGEIPLDLIETGGGGGSSTVISPEMHREFCLPYDKKQHKALRDHGTKVVYHLCGGVMPMLPIVAENGADGLETMTPPSMGGDCDLGEAARLVGDKLFFVGGFDQNAGFEKGNPAAVRKMVFELFSACPGGGFILSPSDHFFFGNPENVRAFADAVKECAY